MTEILTSAQMRATERAAIDSGTTTGLKLMERASIATVEAIVSHWPALADKPLRARVLCGPGNNGGDGYVIARLLLNRGWQVQVVTFGAPDRLPPDARHNFDRYKGPQLDAAATPFPFDGDLSVDAVFGTGLSRPITDSAMRGWLDEQDRFTARGRASVAVDIPSGLDADSGRVLDGSACAHAALTVTFHRAKPGHYLAQGPEYCGRLHVAGIGL
ncbi:NAD(P)H-hydrate epimerase [Roseinatronobacter sp.]|uniref:NAD(P)H-hydrate epimerase n=1 Tax=Roseinatronobacter sp. TaxID=1945755 RepID=UPI00343791F4